MIRKQLVSINRGITLITLSITIIVLLILSGITINTSMNIVEKAQLEELRTNMLLIKAKAKEYVENANFKLGIKEEEKDEKLEIAKEELKGTKLDVKPDYIKSTDSKYVCYYKLTTEQLEEMGISNIKSDDNNGWYVVEYDIENLQVEVYYSKGIQGKNALTDIENLSM